MASSYRHEQSMYVIPFVVVVLVNIFCYQPLYLVTLGFYLDSQSKPFHLQGCPLVFGFTLPLPGLTWMSLSVRRFAGLVENPFRIALRCLAYTHRLGDLCGWVTDNGADLVCSVRIKKHSINRAWNDYEIELIEDLG